MDAHSLSFDVAQSSGDGRTVRRGCFKVIRLGLSVAFYDFFFLLLLAEQSDPVK